MRLRGRRAIVAQALAEFIQCDSRTLKRVPNVVHHAVCIHGLLFSAD